MKLKSELNQIKNFIIKITRKKNNLYIDHFYDDDVINDYFEEE